MRANHISQYSSRMIQVVSVLLIGLLAAIAPATAQPSFGSGGSPFGGRAPNVEASVQTRYTAVARGEILPVAVTIKHRNGFHTWPVKGHADLGPDFEFAIRTEIGLASDAPVWSAVDHQLQLPELYEARVMDPTGQQDYVRKPTYHEDAVFYLPISIAADAPLGEQTLTVALAYQACDETECLAPEYPRFEISFTVVEAGAAAQVRERTEDLFSGMSEFELLEATADGEAPLIAEESGRAFFGISIPSPTSPLGIVVIALLAALGGAILNLTPCVLPVIPIKIMTISAHANSPGKSLVLGLWMALGVIAFWAGLGVLAASFSAFADPSRLFGIWWITGGIGLLIGAMGIGIMGAFEIKLPKAVYAVNPKADSATGSFGFGVMTAVLGLPCFGFVAGALLAGSATLPWGVVMTIFVAMGVGMAMPYLILSASPKLVKRIPKTGPGSELVKQVMGLLLLAAAVYFIGAGVFAFLGGTAGLPWWMKSIHWWVIGLFALGAGGWLAYRTFRISKTMAPKVGMAVVGLIIATGGVAAAVDRSVSAYTNFWVAYSVEDLDRARQSGNVVVLDFTAEWCLNCIALKSSVLSQNPVKPVLQGAGVVPMTVDLTSRSAAGWDKLSELGQTGIPLLVIYGPGTGDEPWMANNYTQGQVMAAIEAARGKPGG